MGVRSSIKTISKLGFLRMNCRGVNDVMGVPIFVYCCCSVVFEVPTGVVGDDGDTVCLCFTKALS